MSLRESLRPTVARTHDSVFLVGFAVAVFLTVASIATAIVARTVPPLLVPIVELLGTSLTYLVVGPLLVAIYVPVLRGTETTRETIHCGLDAVRSRYWDVFRAVAGALAVVAAAGVFAVSVLYLVETIHSLAVHLTGEPQFIRPLGLFTPLVYAFGVGVVVAALLTQFADVAAVTDGRSPWMAWRESLFFVQRNPLSFLGYLALLGTVVAVQYVIDGVRHYLVPAGFRPSQQLVEIVLVLISVHLLQAGLITLFAGLRVTLYTSGGGLGDRSASGSRLPWRGIAIGAVVLVAGVAGATYVRTVDVGVESEEIAELPDGPQAALEVATSNTARANHRAETVLHNESDDSNESRLYTRFGTDYDDRQRYFYFYPPNGATLGAYNSEATLATRPVYEHSLSARQLAPFTRREGNWSVVVGNGYGISREGSSPVHQLDILNWTVTETSQSTVVYRSTNTERFHEIGNLYRPTARGSVTEDSYAVAVVNRQRGVVREIRFHLRWTNTSARYTQSTRYEGIGTTDVERPEEFGDRRLLGWVFDALYY